MFASENGFFDLLILIFNEIQKFFLQVVGLVMALNRPVTMPIEKVYNNFAKSKKPLPETVFPNLRRYYKFFCIDVITGRLCV